MVASSCEPGANVSALAREIGISPSQLFGRRAAVPKMDGLERAGKDEETGLGRPQAHHSRTIEIDVNGMTVRAGANLCGPSAACFAGGTLSMIPPGVKVYLASHRWTSEKASMAYPHRRTDRCRTWRDDSTAISFLDGGHIHSLLSL